eukprot:TRINITY_DN5565_c0_g1_i2.p1 TRINITY_DN5565_c0_g1~~TRINITY_DN5565_c0_g1_i2.p1  ORF type:complete len:243 (-),score=60.96 TRINITY_DN5565_c0_g1_i2:186-914(-)
MDNSNEILYPSKRRKTINQTDFKINSKSISLDKKMNEMEINEEKNKEEEIDPKEETEEKINKKTVMFSKVYVRDYERKHGGSSGVPRKGGYPLGLSWEYNKEEEFELKKYQKLIEKKKDRGLYMISERKRKEILEKTVEDEDEMEEMEKVKKELEKTRKTREDVGCNCCSQTSRNLCGTKYCFCFKNGLECDVDSCFCDSDCCKNKRNLFDQKSVDKFRKSKIAQANKLLVREMKSSKEVLK